MGFYVHLHVCFSCDQNEPVAELARVHLDLLKQRPEEDEVCEEARWFLESLSGRTGGNFGPKGGLSLWGITGNYTNPGQFVQDLKSFWENLLGPYSERGDAGPLPFEHILVFYENQESGAAGAYEIYRQDPHSQRNREIEIKHNARLPFCWKQM